MVRNLIYGTQHYLWYATLSMLLQLCLCYCNSVYITATLPIVLKLCLCYCSLVYGTETFSLVLQFCLMFVVLQHRLCYCNSVYNTYDYVTTNLSIIGTSLSYCNFAFGRSTLSGEFQIYLLQPCCNPEYVTAILSITLL